MARTTINERDVFEVEYTLRNPDNALSIPTTLRWSLFCETTQTLVMDWVSVTPAATGLITLASSLNAIVNDHNARETKKVTVQANANTAGQVSGVYRYDVVNSEVYL